MAGRILDGKSIAARVRAEVAREVTKLPRPPGLAVVLVGDDPASVLYVRNKHKACAEVGIRTFDRRLDAGTDTDTLLRLIQDLNRDAQVDGILVQLPLPPGIDAQRVVLALDPGKDVDAFHPENVGFLVAGTPRFVPCTPAGAMRLLEEAKVSLTGAEVVVIGRSPLVGRPLASLLTASHATVTLCHSRTRDLGAVVRRAEILIAAVGRPGLIRGEWIRDGAVVIDVGINRLPDGKIVGDVEFEVALTRASAITPVPGGVGPMTIAMLCANTLRAAQIRSEP